MSMLVLTVIGGDRSGIVNAIAEVVAEHGGNWERSQMAELAGAFAGIIVVEVAGDRAPAFTRAVTALPDITVAVHDADAVATPEPTGRVSLELVGNDRPGIVKDLSAVFSEHGISIEEFETDTRDAPMYGGHLFEARITAPVAPGTDMDALRADLERLASELMVDITLEDEAE